MLTRLTGFMLSAVFAFGRSLLDIMVCGFPRSARKTAHRRSEVPYDDVDLLPDDQIALFQAIDDLNLDRSLDTDCDRRAAGAVALTDFDEMAAFKRPDR